MAAAMLFSAAALRRFMGGTVCGVRPVAVGLLPRYVASAGHDTAMAKDAPPIRTAGRTDAGGEGAAGLGRPWVLMAAESQKPAKAEAKAKAKKPGEGEAQKPRRQEQGGPAPSTGNEGGEEPDDDRENKPWRRHFVLSELNKLTWYEEVDWYLRGLIGKYALQSVMEDVDADFDEGAFLDGTCDALCAITEQLGSHPDDEHSDGESQPSKDVLKRMVGSRMYRAMRETEKDIKAKNGLKTVHRVMEIYRCQVTQVQIVPDEEREWYEDQSTTTGKWSRWREVIDVPDEHNDPSVSDPHRQPDWDAGRAAGSPAPGSQPGWLFGSDDSSTNSDGEYDSTRRHLLVHVRFFVREVFGVFDKTIGAKHPGGITGGVDRDIMHTLIFARGPLPSDDVADEEERRRQYHELPWVVLDIR